MKLRCLQCENSFEGGISKDALGWHSSCPKCGGSFDVDVPEGQYVIAFTDAVDEEENPYKYFTEKFTGEHIVSYYAFNTVEELINKWSALAENPEGMWYFIMDNGHVFCSGACDPDDIEIIREHFGIKEEAVKGYVCKLCGAEFEVEEDEDTDWLHEYGEEMMWGHLQVEHEDVFEEVQDWETPFMLEEYYDEVR